MQPLGIIIVNWNTGKLLQECLESIQKLPQQEHDLIAQVVVVDNASRDDSLARVKAQQWNFPVQFIEKEKNTGFSAANNEGIEVIRKTHPNAHILLLNPDTVVHEDALMHMLRVFEQDPRCGIVGAHLLNPDGTLQPSVRKFPTLPVIMMFFLKLHRLFPRSKTWQSYMMSSFSYEKQQHVDQVMGAAFLIRSELLHDIGSLDESFWIWFEEVDFCKRAVDRGWRVTYTPHALITHKGGASFNQLAGFSKRLLFLGSALTYAKKHLAPFAQPLRTELSWALVATAAIACISLFVSLQAGVVVLFLSAVAWWTWKYPEEGFLLCIVVAPLLPMLKITQTLGTFTLIKDAIILTLFMRLVAVPLLTKTLRYQRNMLFAPVIALVCWSVFETLRSSDLLLGILRLRDIVLYILLYVAVLYLPGNKLLLRRSVVWFLTSFVIVLALGAYQWWFSVDSAVLRFDPARSIWIPRLSSILAHPSIYGQYLITGLVVASVAFLTSTNRRTKILLSLIGVATLVSILLTYSRGVWIGAAAALMGFAAARGISRIPHKTSVVVVCIILGILALRFTPAGGLVRSVVDPTYGSNEERLEFVSRLVASTKTHEVFIGKGLGDVFEQNLREVDVSTHDIASGASRAVQQAKDRTLVDNQYLKTFIEMGVVGLVLYGWLYWRLARTKSLLATGFLATFVIQGLFIDIWDIFPTNAAFWIIAALAHKTSTLSDENIRV